jgi:MoaA/NifB/PqqE/SkfB family radical SAM enzyme
MRYLQNMKLMNEALNSCLFYNNTPQSLGFPEEITLTATLRCNYRCSMCYQQHYHGDLDWAVMDKLTEILPFARTIQLFGGEPLLYPRLDELFALCRDNECNIHLITNASLLDPDKVASILNNRVRHIKCSIDAGSAKTYAAIRGGNFLHVLRNVASLTETRDRFHLKTPTVHFQFLAMRSNIHELGWLVKIAASMGVEQVNVVFPDLSAKDLEAKESLRATPQRSDEEMLKALELGRQTGVRVSVPALFGKPAERDEAPAEGVRGYERCSDPWRKLLVSIDGTVNLCCQGLPPVGNLLDADFDAIWNADLVQRIRGTINTPDEFPACRVCSLRRPMQSKPEAEASRQAA